MSVEDLKNKINDLTKKWNDLKEVAYNTQNDNLVNNANDNIVSNLKKALDTLNTKEIANLVKYPPQNLTGYTTNITNAQYGNGSYIVSASVERNGPGTCANAFKTGEQYWWKTGWQINPYPTSTTTLVSDKSYTGEWVQLQMPTSIVLSKYSITTTFANNPIEWVIAGSNDGNKWKLLDYRQYSSIANGKLYEYDITNTQSYKYYRFIYIASNGAYPYLSQLVFYNKEVIKYTNTNVNEYLQYYGCYADSGDRRIRHYDRKGSGSIQNCYNTAKARGHNVFGLQCAGCGGQCWTDNDLNRALSYGRAQERVRTSWDWRKARYRYENRNKNCNVLGDSWTNQVYRIEKHPNSNISYHGCYGDDGSRKLPTGNGQGNGSIENCYNTAKARGHSVFGLQYYGQCWTGNDLAKAKSLGPRNCDNALGVAWTNQVYTITDPDGPIYKKAEEQYSIALKLYNDIYKKIRGVESFSTINKINEALTLNDISRKGISGSDTANKNADYVFPTDQNSYQLAQTNDTKGKINYNANQAMGITQNNAPSSYNSQFLNSSNIKDAYNYSLLSQASGENKKNTSEIVKNDANSLSKIANREYELVNAINILNAANTNIKKFVDKYINDVNVWEKKIDTYRDRLASNHTKSDKYLNTPFNKQISAAFQTDDVEIDFQQADAEKRKIIDDKNSEYEFVNFDINSIRSYPRLCAGVTTDSNTTLANMSLLDNNLHTFKSCKISSSIANKPYFAIVKPAGDTFNGYKCYVSDDKPENLQARHSVSIFEYGPSNGDLPVKFFGLDTNGNFYAEHTNGSISNIATVNDIIYGGSGCKYYLSLTDDGNIKIHAMNCNPNFVNIPEIAWQSYSKKEIQGNAVKLLPYGPRPNGYSTKSGTNTINAGSKTDFLVSPNGYFWLKIENGHVKLKATVYTCKYTNDISGNYNLIQNDTNYLYTDENPNANGDTKKQSYYLYSTDTRHAKSNTPYYRINSYGIKNLQPIDFTDPKLKNIKNDIDVNLGYDVYPGYSATSNNPDEKWLPQQSQDMCMKTCNSDPNCNYVYHQNNNCYIGKKNIPDFIPNDNSTLYIRKKYYDMSTNFLDNPQKINGKFSNKSDYLSYSEYNFDSPITGNFVPGYPSNPLFKKYDNIAKKTVFGTSAKEGLENQGAGYGFNPHGYSDPTDACINQNEEGCKNAMLERQFNPLNNIAKDYERILTKISKNNANLDNNMAQYSQLYNLMSAKDRYDFSGNQEFSMEDRTIQNRMKQDTKELLLQENNFYIAGSLLTATLLLSGIYLAK
jgi:hypothetical protein